MPTALRIRQVLAATIVLIALSGFAIAETETATLSGVIRDPKGAVVPDVDLVVTRIETGTSLTTTTNGAGVYVFSSLQPGHFRLFVRKPGFKEVVVQDIALNVQDQVEQNFSLQVGSVSESITVTSTAPLIHTEDAAVSTNVDRQFVRELPLNGRSFQTLFQLTPGAVITNASYAEQGQFSINGQRANANYFMVDGVSANVGMTHGFGPGQSVGGSLPALTQGGGTNGLVSVDAMQEFSIQTSGYAPEFGRTPGGQISVLTRSGTNQFHGGVFDYLRNDVVDANDWFANNLGLKRAALRQNDFGGVFGGPILKERTFFFLSYEALRLRQPTTGITDVPSLSTRQSASSAIQPFANAFPLPTGLDEGNGLAPGDYGFSNPSDLNAESVRVDHHVGTKVSFFARYNRSTSDLGTRGGGGASLNTVGHLTSKLDTVTSGVTWMLRPTLSNDLRFNWSWNRASNSYSADTFGGAVPISLTNVVAKDENPTTSHFRLTIDSGNTSSLLYGPIARHLQRQLNLLDTVSWQIREHLFRIGVDYRRLTPQVNLTPYDQEIDFLSASDFATGNPTGGVFVAANFSPVDVTYDNYSVFGQDTWKVIPRLTITYGLRWDYNPAPDGHGPNGLPTVAFVSTSDLTKLAPAPLGTPLYHASLDNLAPRLGLVYNVRDSDKYAAVLRTGFGVFYDIGNGPTGNVYTGFPFTNFNAPAAASFPLSPADAEAPKPSLAPPFGFVTAFPRGLRQPYTYHWNLTWEQSTGLNQTLVVSYLGAAGHSLIRQDLFAGGPLSANFAGVFSVTNLGYSNYNALQIQVRRRQAKRLEILGSYTWSHSLDNVSADSTTVSPLSVTPIPSANYSSADFDVRHTGSVAVDYQVPTIGHSKIARILSRQWGVNTFLIARTAQPLEVLVNRDLGFGFQTYRPDVVPGASPYISIPTAPGGSVVNPLAFSVPLAPVQGNLRRNALRAFPLFQQDVSIRRSFDFHERLRLQVRLEAFNVLNHPNFAPPQNVLGSVSGGIFAPQSGFGISRSMFASGAADATSGAGFSPLYQVGGPRALQLALKFDF